MGKAEITRQYIIEKTAPVFNKKGYAATSMIDLTKATGLTKGSIYGNFINKDEVALEAFKYNMQLLVELFSPEIRKARGSIKRLLTYVKVYKQNFYTILENGGCPILNTAVDAENTHEELKRAAQRAIRSWRINFEKIIADGIREGEIRKDVDPKFFSGLFFSIVEGSFMVANVSMDKKIFDKNMDHLKEIMKQQLPV